MPINIFKNNDLELHDPIVEEKKWPWTNKWLDYQRNKLSFTEEQCKEIEKKANEKFAEMVRENVSYYSDETKKRIHDDIEHIHLYGIVESVTKYNPQDIINANFESDVASKSFNENKKSNQVMKNDVFSNSKKTNELNPKLTKDVDAVSMSAADVSETISEDELEELKKRRKMAEENLASNQSSGQVSESKVNISKKYNLVEEKSPNQATSPFGIRAIANPSVLSDASERSANRKGNLTKHQAKELLGQFKNYGMSLGFSGGTRSKVRDLAENTTFLFDYKDKLVSNLNNGVVELTFNGNCANRHYVELKNGCYVGIDYNSKTGAVKILKDVLFHKSGDQFDHIVDLKKTGGFFGKSDLEKVLGSKRAAEDVKKSLKNLKLIACSNPNPIEGIDAENQPRRQVTAMVDGKSHGSQLTTGQKIALAAGLLAVGVGAALTGVGILFGGAALVAASGVAISAVSNAGVAASSGVVAAANIVAANTVFAANQVASGTLHLVNHIGQTNLKLAADEITSVANNSSEKVASVFTNLGNDIASGATNLGNNIANQFGNTSGQGSSIGLSSSATVASVAKDVVNNPLTVPVSIAAGVGLTGGVAAVAASSRQKNKGSLK